jgi:Domain of unknown function (DUF4129)
MPDRLRARAALTALLLLLTAAGIRAIGPAVALDLPERARIIEVGVALEAVLAALLIALRWRQPATDTDEAGDLATRLRKILSAVIVTVLIVVPIAILFGSLGKPSGKSRAVRPEPIHLSFRPPKYRKIPLHPASPAAVHLVEDVVLAILILAIVAIAVAIWRRGRIKFVPLEADDDADTPADLARAVDSGRQALREVDDARAAIIRCYLAMEASLAGAGAAREVAETPDELLGRAVTADLINPVPAGRLTSLFYEARFSSHPMPPQRRDDAERALAGLAASLPAEPAASTAGADT